MSYNLTNIQTIANWAGFNRESLPHIIDFCKHCGTALLDHQDFDRPKWEDETCWNGCLHEAANATS